MMDRIVPGGVTIDLDDDGIDEMLRELDTFTGEFERLVIIYDENPSLEDRVRETGSPVAGAGEGPGDGGIVARASGQSPWTAASRALFLPMTGFVPKVPVYQAGDVNARVWVRIDEIRESVRLAAADAGELPAGEIRMPFSPRRSPTGSGFALVEGWRGEIVYWVQSGATGEINRCMVRDPSSVNWLGLEQAFHGNIVPDFPVCNKSFNPSYSGHDL